MPNRWSDDGDRFDPRDDDRGEREGWRERNDRGAYSGHVTGRSHEMPMRSAAPWMRGERGERGEGEMRGGRDRFARGYGYDEMGGRMDDRSRFGGAVGPYDGGMYGGERGGSEARWGTERDPYAGRGGMRSQGTEGSWERDARFGGRFGGSGGEQRGGSFGLGERNYGGNRTAWPSEAMRGRAVDERYGRENVWNQQGYAGYGRYEGWDRDRGHEEGSFGDRIREEGHRLVEGIKNVFRGPKGYKRSDERIKEDVCDRIAHRARFTDLDASEVDVAVSSGEVTLTGTVDDRRWKHVIEDIADEVSGVTDVHNQIRVKRQGAPMTATSSTAASTPTTTTTAGATRTTTPNGSTGSSTSTRS